MDGPIIRRQKHKRSDEVRMQSQSSVVFSIYFTRNFCSWLAEVHACQFLQH